MRIGNITMLFAALICAAAAALLSRAWLKGQAGGERVMATTQHETPAVPTRSVVVAARELKYGEKLKADMLRLMPWQGDTVPKGAFLTPEPLIQAGQERVVLAAVAENEPLLEGKLSGSAQGALAAKLADSMNAVTIRVNDVAGVAGFVQPDDRVDVFLTMGGQPTDDPARSTKPSVVVLLQNVRVLATDQATQRKSQASPPKAVTLEVTTGDAQKLVLAGSIGQLSLALRRLDGVEASATRPIALEDLIANRAVEPAPAAKTAPIVGVTRSVERKEYMVPPETGKGRRSEAVR
jgi:pilus assembly protein CpaB